MTKTMRKARYSRWLAILALIVTSSRVFSHEDEPHDYQELWRAWSFEPFVVIGLALSAWLYARGLRRLWRSGKIRRGIRTWEAWCYAGGWLALVIALVSPLHAWGSALFSAHMTQHEILMLVAAPLLVLGRPLIAFLKALPSKWAYVLVWLGNASGLNNVWRIVTHPFVAWLIHAAALWIWHVPVLFQATLNNEFVHALQHSSFLFSALLFWWAVMHGRQRMLGYGAAVLYMFTTAMHSGLLGALITFAHGVIYPAYTQTTGSWGFTPLEDQQLGGLIMWVPAGLVYVIAGLALFAGWLRESEARAVRHEMEHSAKPGFTIVPPRKPMSPPL
jgi:putative membrane protein